MAKEMAMTTLEKLYDTQLLILNIEKGHLSKKKRQKRMISDSDLKYGGDGFRTDSVWREIIAFRVGVAAVIFSKVLDQNIGIFVGKDHVKIVQSSGTCLLQW